MTTQRIIYFSFLAILLATLLGELDFLNDNSTYLIGILDYFSFGCLVYINSKIKLGSRFEKTAIVIFILFISWNLVTIVRGYINAKDYWDYKFLFLVSSLSLLIPLCIVLSTIFLSNVKTFRFVITKLFPFSFLLIPIALIYNREMYPRIVMPVTFFLLFAPYFKKNWRIMIYVVGILALGISLGYRANVLRVFISLLLAFSFYYRSYINNRIFKFAYILFFIIPPTLLYLGVTGQFNIFQSQSSHSISVTQGTDTEDLSADTRTLLYQEVLIYMEKENSFILGEGGTAKYQSELFDDLGDNRGRYGSEVGFLDVLLYSGIIGVILYLLILLVASYYAIWKSNNYLSKVIGLFVAFHWVMFFIEDIPTFNLNFYFLWIAIGLCLIKSFRKYSDTEINKVLKVMFKGLTRNLT